MLRISKTLLVFLLTVTVFSCGSNNDNKGENNVESIEEDPSCIELSETTIRENFLSFLASDFNVSEDAINQEFSYINYEDGTMEHAGYFTPEAINDTSIFTYFWKTDTMVDRYYSAENGMEIKRDTFSIYIQIELGPVFENNPKENFENEFNPIPLKENQENIEVMNELPIKAEISGEMDITNYIKTYELKGIGDKAAWFYAPDQLIVLNDNKVIKISADISSSCSIPENYEYALKIYNFLYNCGELPN